MTKIDMRYKKPTLKENLQQARYFGIIAFGVWGTFPFLYFGFWYFIAAEALSLYLLHWGFKKMKEENENSKDSLHKKIMEHYEKTKNEP